MRRPYVGTTVLRTGIYHASGTPFLAPHNRLDRPDPGPPAGYFPGNRDGERCLPHSPSLAGAGADAGPLPCRNSGDQVGLSRWTPVAAQWLHRGRRRRGRGRRPVPGGQLRGAPLRHAVGTGRSFGDDPGPAAHGRQGGLGRGPDCPRPHGGRLVPSQSAGLALRPPHRRRRVAHHVRLAGPPGGLLVHQDRAAGVAASAAVGHGPLPSYVDLSGGGEQLRTDSRASGGTGVLRRGPGVDCASYPAHRTRVGDGGGNCGT